MMKMVKLTNCLNFLFHEEKLFAFLSKILDPRLISWVRRFRMIFFSVLSEKIFAHIVPVSNENENERRALFIRMQSYFTFCSYFGTYLWK
jgi:hypothetical protein